MSNPEWTIYGLIHINFEEEGYSPIIENGETQPILKVPQDVGYGWKHLTAIYSDEFKKIYHNTLKRTKLFHGAKVWVNCPCIFINPGEKSVNLRADVFAHNRRIPSGKGIFFYNNFDKNTSLLDVMDGSVAKSVNIPSQLDISDTSVYSFIFDVNYDYELAPDMNSGQIFINSPTTKPKLVVDIDPIICNSEEWIRLSARVYRRDHATVINYPDDIPSGGYVVFYIDGTRIWFDGTYKCPLNESGFASIKFKVGPKWTVGTHTLTATYYPDTPELQSNYVKTSGCGTLFIGNDTGKPSLNTQGKLCTYIGNSSKTLTFTSNTSLDGCFELYIDRKLVSSSVVEGSSSVSLSFDTNGNYTANNNYLWNFPGYHNLVLKYITDDELEYPMEYYYYLDDFYIQIPVTVELDGELDNTEQVVEDETFYVGNNLYYLNNSNTTWYAPGDARSRSTTIGNKIKVNVKNSMDEKNIVKNGYIKLTFVTRTQNNNLEGNNYN